MHHLNIVLCYTGSGCRIDSLAKTVYAIKKYAINEVNISVLSDSLNYSVVRRLSLVDEIFLVPPNTRSDSYLDPFWPKLALFDRSTIPFDSFYYFDLSIIIIRRLKGLFSYCQQRDEPFICVNDWWYECHNTCFFRLVRGSLFDQVWSEYLNGRVFLNAFNQTDQDFVYWFTKENNLDLKVAYVPPNLIASYKQSCIDKRLPNECEIIKFHGKPKQYDVVTIENLIKFILSFLLKKYRNREGVWLYPLIAFKWIWS